MTAVTVMPWRVFTVEVRAARRLSPHFLRVTFAGADLDRFGVNGFDQRIKLILPLPGLGVSTMPAGPDWYGEWCALPDELRNPIRTYTVRAVRPELNELDVDFALHGVTGPASSWAVNAGPGSVAGILGPNADFDGPHGGIDWRPPAHAGFLLLGGDETAVPAIAAILEGLPDDAVGEAILEVPTVQDMLELTAPPGVRVTWLPRGEGAHGDRLVPAVRRATRRIFPGRAGDPVTDLADVDVDHDILWEVPDPVADTSRFYAWLAGEAGAIKQLRRHLVAECGVDRRLVAFMGYWRLGRPEG